MNSPLIIQGVAHTVRDGATDRAILAPLTRRFEPGSLTAIEGPSGAGKSTLLAILALTLGASCGALFWGDENLTEMAPTRQARWRRTHLGLVASPSRLVGVMSVHEHLRMNAELFNKQNAEADGIAILARLGMSGKLARRAEDLSGGERQCLALALAICRRPSVLLADEPTAALDRDIAKRVIVMLRDCARRDKAVVVCVSQDDDLSDCADAHVRLSRA